MVTDKMNPWPNFTLAHELVHILQIAEGRNSYYPHELLEHEASLIANDVTIIAEAK